jgi:chloride channel 3/4/5
MRPTLRNEASEAWATIDTFHDRELAEKQRVAAERKRIFEGGIPLLSMITQSQALMSGVVGGIVLALIAVWIGVTNMFMVSIRSGVCIHAFWLNEELCCPSVEGGCSSFVTWGEYFSGEDGVHKPLINYVLFMTIGAFGAVASAILCKFYAPFAAGGGINEVKTVVSGHIFDRYFSGITLVFKAITVAMTTGCGLCVGKEGPFVHIGACVGDLVGGLFPAYENLSLRRELIAAGAGAGMAAAFGAPVGGVIFVIEEITSIFSFKVMIQTLIFGLVSVLVLRQFDVEHSGRIVQFSINFNRAWHWFELPLFMVLGAFCGLAGSLLSEINVKWVRVRKSTFLKRWPITEIFVLVLISNTIGYLVPTGKKGLLGLLADMYRDCDATQIDSGNVACQFDDDLFAVVSFLAAASSKMILNAVTVGTMVPAGVLVPALATGSLFGRAFGIMIASLQSVFSTAYFFNECSGAQLCVTPAAYAVVGSAAFLTGVTRMTVCLAVIMFELTGGLEYIVPIVIGILSAKAAGEFIGVESTYEIMIEENKMPYIDPKFDFNQSAFASDIIHAKQYVTVAARGNTVADVNDILEKNRAFAGFPVVDAENTLVGYVTRKALIGGLQRLTHIAARNPRLTIDTPVYFDESGERGSVDFSSIVESTTIQVPPSCSVQRLLNIFKSLGSRHVIVTNLSKFQGIITKKDLIKFIRDVGMH